MEVSMSWRKIKIEYLPNKSSITFEPLPNPEYDYVTIVTEHAITLCVEHIMTNVTMSDTTITFDRIGPIVDKFGRKCNIETLMLTHRELMNKRFPKFSGSRQFIKEGTI
jgi:hypothetical protein